MSKSIQDYCNTLEIPFAKFNSATELEKQNIVKRDYRRLALTYHPDKHPPERQAEATAQFQAIQEAYEILMHAENRSRVTRQNARACNVRPSQQQASPIPAQPSNYKFDMRHHVAYFTKQPLKGIEKAANKANKKLVDDFERKTEEIFAEAYKKYKANSEFYYAKYKKSLYDKYVQSKQEPLNRGLAIAETTYVQEVKPAKIAFYAGISLFFLVVPLIAAGIGYYFMRKAVKTKQQAINSLNEQYKCKTQDKWEEDQVNVKTKAQWEQNGQYSLEEFILPNNKTDEGEMAQKTYDQLREECITKCRENSEVAIKHTNFMLRRTTEEAKQDIVDELTSYVSPCDAESPRNAQAEQASGNDRPNSPHEDIINSPSLEPSPYHQHRPPSPPLALA